MNVKVSHRFVNLADTYIALSAQSTITIENNSDVPIDFSWRAFPTVEEEIAQKLKLQVQLKQEETEEHLFYQQVHVEEEPLSDPDGSGVSEDEETRTEQKVTRALQRKYRNISRAVMEDPMSELASRLNSQSALRSWAQSCGGL